MLDKEWEMPRTARFGKITFCSDERLRLGPPRFKRLRRILIGELLDFALDECPPDARSDIELLRSMDPEVEVLQIGTMIAFRGGIDIGTAERVVIGDIISGCRIPPDSADPPVLFDREAPSIQIDYVEKLSIDNVMALGDQAPSGHFIDRIIITLPRHVQARSRWAPVHVDPRPYRSTG